MTVEEALVLAEEQLAEAGVDTPRVDAEWLVAHVLGVRRTELLLEPDRDVPGAFGPLLERRRKREPLAYVLGEWGFRRLTLKTDARALVPRPETEVVVERCLDLLRRDLLRRESAPRVLDVGVGSGAIALSIAAEHPRARVTAVDTSRDSLELARENAERLALAAEIREGGLEVAAEGWDLVVSNPPYTTPAEWDSLQPEIRDWEPRAALVGEGLQQEIARRANTRWLVLEVGDGQASGVAGELASLEYTDVTISPDLSGRARVVEGRRS